MTSAELREQRMNIAKQMTDIVGKEKMTGEDEQAFDRMEKEERELKVKIDRMEKVESLQKDISEVRGAPVGREERIADTKVSQQSASEKRDLAFRTMIRRGVSNMASDLVPYLEQRDLSAVQANGSTGGYLVPSFWESNLVEILKDFNGVRQAPVSFLVTDGGNPINYPKGDDTANDGEIVSENVATLSDENPSFDTVALKAFNFSSKMVPVPIQLLQDSAVNVDTLLPKWLGVRIARHQQDLFTYGNGTTEPEGIATSAGSSGITLDNDDLSDGQKMWEMTQDAIHSIDPAYRKSSSFGLMFSDDTLRVYKRLVDSQKRPLWVPEATAGAPDRIAGVPYYINQSMDNTTATDANITSSSSAGHPYKPILVGDFAAFLVRDVRGVTLMRLTERAAEKFQVIFLAFQRSDSRMLNSAAIKSVRLVS